jgi:hypothetical protein
MPAFRPRDTCRFRGIADARPQQKGWALLFRNIQKLRYGDDYLHRRKWLLDNQTIGNAICMPFMRALTRYIHNWKGRIQFPGTSRHLPTRLLISPYVYVGDQSAESRVILFQRSNCSLGPVGYLDIKAAVGQRGLYRNRDERIVIQNQNNRPFGHNTSSRQHRSWAKLEPTSECLSMSASRQLSGQFSLGILVP